MTTHDDGNLICRYCGKRYHGEPGTVCCPSCASLSAGVIRTRVCRECGKDFPGGPRAWYCPDCRAERKKAQSRDHKARERAGTTRKIGSEDICIVCGKPYIVMSGNQHYCPECAVEAVTAIDRQQGREYGKLHNDERQERRHQAKASILCRFCRKPFVPNGGELTCSRECSEALKKQREKEFEIKNRDRRNEYRRDHAAGKVAAMTAEEYAEYREKINAKARENYKKRKERKNGNDD